MAGALKPLRIGLTGGIGSGKSTVATLLAAHHATVIDTDAIARELTQPGGQAIAPIAQEFGQGMLDAAGALDRARMRELVFGSTEAKRRLEAILHPMIGAHTERRAALASTPAIVFDVPLLVESGRWRDRVDRVLVVDCSEAAQLERVVARSGWTPDAVAAVIAQQADRSARRSCADAVLFNEGVGFDALAAEVAELALAWGFATLR